MRFSIAALSIMSSITTLSIMLCWVVHFYRHACCHYAECPIFVVMLSVILTSAIMLNVIILSVVMCRGVDPLGWRLNFRHWLNCIHYFSNLLSYNYNNLHKTKKSLFSSTRIIDFQVRLQMWFFITPGVQLRIFSWS